MKLRSACRTVCGNAEIVSGTSALHELISAGSGYFSTRSDQMNVSTRQMFKETGLHCRDMIKAPAIAVLFE